MRFTFSDNGIKIIGRTHIDMKNMLNARLHLSQPYSGIEFNFFAKTVTAHIYTNSPYMQEIHKAYIGVVLDDDPNTFKKIPTFEGEGDYVLFESKAEEKHKLSVFKVSENYMAYVAIGSITTNTRLPLLTRPDDKKLLVEFIGDSITCGYGIESMDPLEKFTTEKENVYFTYAAQAARHFDMDVRFVSRSGIGLYSSWTDKEVPNDELLMGEYYLKTDSYYDTLRENTTGKHYWDFESSRPADLVVINLGTNDASFTKGHHDREEKFAAAYLDFVALVREKNPNSKILCVYGAYEKTLLPVIRDCVEKMSKAGDSKLFMMELPDHDEADGYGCDNHPSRLSHDKMAKQLISVMEEIL